MNRSNFRFLVALVALWVVIELADARAGTVASAPQPPAQPQLQSRADHILYSIPPGWKHTEKEKYTALEAPDVPGGNMVEVRIYPAKPLSGTLQGAATAEVERFNGSYANVQASPMNPIRHENGFDMIITGVSWMVPGGAAYDALCFVQAGDCMQIVELQTNDFQLYEKHKLAHDALLHSMRVSDATVLAEGNPPLTQATVDEVSDFLEWLMEVPFTEDQRKLIEQNIVESWKKNDRADIEGTLEVRKLRAQLSAMTSEQKQLARQAAQPELIKAAQKETDAVAKMIVQVYENAHQPIAQGEPPLTRQSADALLEMLFFMASQVQGGDAAAAVRTQPTQQMKDEWAKNLAANYDKTDAAARQSIAKMPMTWAAVRMLWTDLPEADKAAARAQWGQSTEVKQMVEVISKMRPPPAPQQPGGGAAGGAGGGVGGGGNGYFAEGKDVIHVDGTLRYVVFNMESEEAAKARAAEMNKGREKLLGTESSGDASAAEMMANRTRDYEFTKSMLNMGHNNTIMQMSAISGNQWRYK